MPRWLYSLIYTLLLPLVLLRLWWRSFKAPAYAKRWGERFACYGSRPASGGVWFHTVSVGETIAAAPLIKQVQAAYPELPITITTMTPTGSERVQALFGDAVFHVYVPYDIPLLVTRFLQQVQPKLAVIMETELWPNLIAGCDQREIPVVIANARLSERSAKGYGRLGSLTRNMLQQVHRVAAQHQDDGGRFVELGLPAERLAVTGSVKFDIQPAAELSDQAQQLRAQWQANERPVWIAASTHEGEDEQVLAAHQLVLAEQPEALLLLVPRHPERFKRVAELCQKQGFSMARRSLLDAVEPSTQVMLGDTMGELMLLYAAADIAFVGGSLVPTGGHNMLEPVALEVPVVTGPHLFNFADISQQLIQAGAMQKVDDADALSQTVLALMSHAERYQTMQQAGKQVMATNQGAQQRLFELVSAELG